MTIGSAAREAFAAVIAREPIPLDEAALAIAAEEYPRLDAGACLAHLDALGARVLSRAAAARAASVLRALREVLAGEEGLHGTVADYADPRSSFVNEVLVRGVGLPSRSRSSTWRSDDGRGSRRRDRVARPLRRPLPPRRARRSSWTRFTVGRCYPADDCLSRYRARTGRELDRRVLGPATPRQIVLRMLGNLRRLYAARKDDVRAWWVLDRDPARRAGLPPRCGIAGSRRRGLGAVAAAARDLEAYLARAPDAQDADDVRIALAELRHGPPRAS